MTQQDDSIQIVPDPDKLDRYHRQQLSAMLDGELSPDQARFMLRRLQHDLQLADCWERWQVCGDVLRGQRNALLPADFAQKVSVAIAAGGARAPDTSSRAGGPRLLRWGGGAALAASVAMAALLVGRQAGIDPDQSPVGVVPEWAASAEGDTGPKPGDEPGASPETGSAVVLAGAALAAAEAPRRAAERRGRAQQPDGVATASQTAVHDVDQAALAAAKMAYGGDFAAAPALGEVAPRTSTQAALTLPGGLEPVPQGIGTDPFQALPMTVASRPWPRAAARMAGDYAVGFGDTMPAAPEWAAAWGPRRAEVAELFRLPSQAPPPLPGSFTAIGTRAISAGAHWPVSAQPYSGPR